MTRATPPESTVAPNPDLVGQAGLGLKLRAAGAAAGATVEIALGRRVVSIDHLSMRRLKLRGRSAGRKRLPRWRPSLVSP
jgi:hypothetical protein